MWSFASVDSVEISKYCVWIIALSEGEESGDVQQL